MIKQSKSIDTRAAFGIELFKLKNYNLWKRIESPTFLLNLFRSSPVFRNAEIWFVMIRQNFLYHTFSLSLSSFPNFSMKTNSKTFWFNFVKGLIHKYKYHRYWMRITKFIKKLISFSKNLLFANGFGFEMECVPVFHYLFQQTLKILSISWWTKKNLRFIFAFHFGQTNYRWVLF